MEKKKHKGPFQARRERRIERRRQEIMEAAAQVFAERGYANATTKEIALVADLAMDFQTLFVASNGATQFAQGSVDMPQVTQAGPFTLPVAGLAGDLQGVFEVPDSAAWLA